MKITATQLQEALLGVICPYSGGPPNEVNKAHFLGKLCEEQKDYIADALEEFNTLGEAILDDIRDDIQNCGRNPFSKFLQERDRLIILYLEENPDLPEILEYLANQISEDLS